MSILLPFPRIFCLLSKFLYFISKSFFESFRLLMPLLTEFKFSFIRTNERPPQMLMFSNGDKEMEPNFPILFLSIPSTSGSSERLFSKAGLFIQIHYIIPNKKNLFHTQNYFLKSYLWLSLKWTRKISSLIWTRLILLQQ